MHLKVFAECLEALNFMCEVFNDKFASFGNIFGLYLTLVLFHYRVTLYG